MDQYNFVGTSCTIGDQRLERFGQPVSLSREVAQIAVAGKASIVPAARFAVIGFTAEELQAYAYIGQRSQAPESFQAKLRAAVAQIGVAEDEDEG